MNASIRAVLTGFLGATDVPGVAAALFTAAGPAGAAGCGVRGLDRPGEAMTARTVGTVLSLTKVMTAAALGVVAGRGDLDLAEPVSRHLPDVPGRERFETTTTAHLLGHASGLVRGPLPMPAAPLVAQPLERYVLGACLGAPRIAEPGEVFGYSELGIVIAGYLLQRIVRRPYPVAMHEVLFAPAGLRDTTFDPLVAMTRPLAQQHARGPDGRLSVLPRFDLRPSTQPSSGALSSVEDLARLGTVLLGGAGSLLGAAARRALVTPVADVGLDIQRSFGLALTLGPSYAGHLGAGHEGYHDGTFAKLVVVPDLGIGAAWLDNRGLDAGGPDESLDAARQEHFDRLLGLLGAGPRSWARPPEPEDRTAREHAPGRYARPAGRPLTVRATATGLEAGDGVVTVPYEHRTGRVYVGVGPPVDRLPWAPDKDSSRSALALVGPATCPTHVLLNGLPYQRQ